MTIFFAALSKSGAPDIRESELVDYLPISPASMEIRSSPTCSMMVFRWNTALDRPIVDATEHSIIIAGNPIFPANYNEASLIHGNAPNINARMRGGYSGAWITDGRMEAFASMSADFPLFVRETHDLICVSNRFALLLGVGDEPPLDRVALSSIASNGYIYGSRTTHEGINRVEPGAVMIATRSGISFSRPPLAELFSPIRPMDAMPLIYEGIESATAELSSISLHQKGNMIPLSGGKDSRAIIGMVKAAGNLDKFEAFTNGNLYSPEVISAKEVAQFIDAKHTVRRPPIITSSADLVDRISKTLLSVQGQLAMFDLAGTGRGAGVNIGGHQIGLRDSYFHNYHLSGGNPSQIADQLTRDVPIDGHGLLTASARDDARDNLISICSDLLNRGVPSAKVPTAFMWMVRLFGWLTVMNGAANVAQATVNPLLNVDLMRLAYGLPDDVVSSEVIHFILMNETVPGLADIPFADQNWSVSLSPTLDLLGWKGDKPKTAPEYRSSPFFPNASNPYLPNIKLAVYRILSRFAAANMDDLNMPWLDIPAVKIICRPDSPQTASRSISMTGAFTGMLWAKFGRDLLRHSRQDLIKAELERFVQADDAPPVPSLEEKIKLLEEKLADQESAIGKFVIAERSSRQAQPPKVGAARRYRHIDIENKTSAPLHAWFELADQQKTATHVVSPGSVFSYGVTFTGDVRLRLKSDGGSDETRPISIRDDKFTYVVNVSSPG